MGHVCVCTAKFWCFLGLTTAEIYQPQQKVFSWRISWILVSQMTLKVLYNYYEQRVHGIRLNFLERSYLTDIAQPVKKQADWTINPSLIYGRKCILHY